MAMTKEIAVESSTVATVAYSRDTNTLYVRFKNKRDKNKIGPIYEYSPVQETTFLEMLASESKGKFLNENIKKNDAIEYQKVSE